MFIGAPDEAEGILRGLFDLLTEEGAPLIVVFFLESAEGKNGGGEVNEGDEAVTGAAGLVSFGTEVGE